ncbi:DNA circularization N-terminal domain-containing protein [Paraburkholderia phymatum]|uniref:DNA circulation family protein n=1 Tax=Paraburkholderia phymatum (strain DSM 17167 / CIP 108236 / LMG 21445 / STM815) TaxID=391038 RepID=B2JCZ7_PARP8|nr:DNA circularization N-terminal domain-containing protein [Paraburkholderia phymatum]ACC71053.1 DNA circulation family protein [Paraburkholderia phymatum STM815]
MSTASTIGNAVGSIGGVASAAGAAASDLAKLFNGGTGYWSKLRKASYNGVPFAVLAESGTFGRRNAIHEYPNKETMPWIEDLGLQTNVFRIQAFLVENSLVYGGGDVLAQRDRLIKTIQGGTTGSTKSPGLGTLVHPTYGNLKVNCLQAEIGSSWDRGRVVELRLVFARGGDRLYPKAQQQTSGAVTGAADAVDSTSLSSFITGIASSISAGAAVVKTAVSTVVKWYQTVNMLVHDVKRFWNSLSTLAGNFGRLFGGGNTGYAASNQKAASSATAASLIAADTSNRAAVATAGAALTAAAANVGSDPTTFANAAQGVAAALAASASSPADAIRLLSSLIAFSPTPIVGSSQIAIAQQTMQSACADLFRRATVAQIAISSSTYQPSSADDASSMRDSVTALIDNEIQIAADQGEDDVYTSLRALRQSVVADLDSRGSGLSAIATFTFSTTLPSLALANRMYRDSTRAEELVTQADPIHPAFMPTQFNALSS